MILSMLQVDQLRSVFYDYAISRLDIRTHGRDEMLEFVTAHIARALSEAVFTYGRHFVDPADVALIKEYNQPTFGTKLFRFAWRPRNEAILPTGDRYTLKEGVDVVVMESPLQFRDISPVVAGQVEFDMEVTSKMIMLHRRGWDTEQRAWVMGP